MLVQCCYCGKLFEADPDQARRWANSGLPFDPTDWVCKECADFDFSEPEPYRIFSEGVPYDPDRA